MYSLWLRNSLRVEGIFTVRKLSREKNCFSSQMNRQLLHCLPEWALGRRMYSHAQEFAAMDTFLVVVSQWIIDSIPNQAQNPTRKPALWRGGLGLANSFCFWSMCANVDFHNGENTGLMRRACLICQKGTRKVSPCLKMHSWAFLGNAFLGNSIFHAVSWMLNLCGTR